MGFRGTTPLILNFGAKWGEGLTPGKELRYPWNRRLDGTRVDLDVSEKKIISYSYQYTNPRPS